MLRGYRIAFGDRAAGSGAYLGEVGIYHLATYPAPEIGWMVLPARRGPRHRRRGGARLRDWAYATQGWTTLVSYIDPENARSIRLAERLGARLDPAAPHPEDDPCLVYRHPGPEARP